jgi:hypothetical protein
MGMQQPQVQILAHFLHDDRIRQIRQSEVLVKNRFMTQMQIVMKNFTEQYMAFRANKSLEIDGAFPATQLKPYDNLGGTEYAMFDGSHSFECRRQRKDDRFLFESTDVIT